MNAFLLQTVVKGGGGTGFTSPVKFYDSEEAVKEAMAAHMAELKVIVETGKIVIHTPQGPRANLTVADLFAMLGISNVAVTCTSGEVHGKVLVAGRAPLIIAG